jgi:colanic acid/amylovoran biosynthesis glycosyltransferase
VRVAFINGVFPQLSQTFVLDQIDYAIGRGHDVAVVATRKAPNVTHEKIAKHDLYRCLHAEKSAAAQHMPFVAKGAARNPRTFGRALVSRVVHRRKVPVGSFSLAGQLDHAPDVLLVNFGTNLPTAVRLKKHIFPHARIACIFHGFDLSKYTKEHGWTMYERTAPFVDLALTVNALQTTELRERGLFGRVETLHLGIDVDRLPRRQPHGDDAFSILFVGRAVEKKGLGYLIHAMDALRDQNVRLHVVGAGPLLREEQIHARVRNLSDRVVFYGARDHEFVLSLMASCDCLVAPSVTARDGDAEGIPVTLMEAMAIGIPVISTFHSGIPELVTHMKEGRLVGERDATALADAIRAEMASPGAFVPAAREKVSDHFAMLTQYAKLFASLEALVRK